MQRSHIDCTPNEDTGTEETEELLVEDPTDIIKEDDIQSGDIPQEEQITLQKSSKLLLQRAGRETAPRKEDRINSRIHDSAVELWGLDTQFDSTLAKIEALEDQHPDRSVITYNKGIALYKKGDAMLPRSLHGLNQRTPVLQSMVCIGTIGYRKEVMSRCLAFL